MRTAVIGLAMVALAIARPFGQPAPRPNVVLIMMDDLGYVDAEAKQP